MTSAVIDPPTAPHVVDQLLEVVGDTADLIESGDRRGSLERVDLSEDGPHQRVVTACLFQLEQQLVELAKPNFGFLGEQSAYLLRTHPSHQSALAAVRSLRGR